MKGDVLILDLTEMSGNNVCVAGIDLKSRQHVRLASPSFTRTTLHALRGLAPGDVIAVEYEYDRRWIPPHVEDARWNRLTARRSATRDFDAIVSLLAKDAFDSVEAAFGPAWFSANNKNHAWHPGKGARSLATLRARDVRITLGESKPPKPRMPRVELRDASGAIWRGIPLQDLAIREHSTGCESCASNYLRNLVADFAAEHALVRIGLTRPWGDPERSDHREGCWLQVTNIFARACTHF